jgi:ribosomal protein S21
MKFVPGATVFTRHLEVRSRDGESGESLIRRFVKKVRNEGIMDEYMSKRSFRKPSEVRREKRRLAKYRSSFPLCRK